MNRLYNDDAAALGKDAPECEFPINGKNKYAPINIAVVINITRDFILFIKICLGVNYLFF
jgi:hypothetical protein